MYYGMKEVEQAQPAVSNRIVFSVDEEGKPVVGVMRGEDLILNPRRSPDGQYGVDPVDAYDISGELADQLLKITETLNTLHLFTLAVIRGEAANALAIKLPAEGTEEFEVLSKGLREKDLGLHRAVARAAYEMMEAAGMDVSYTEDLLV